MSDNRGIESDMGSMRSTSEEMESIQVRKLLEMPPESSTEDVLQAIHSLQLQQSHMTTLWEALTDLLYLNSQTPPGEVLGNVNAYIRQTEFLRSQQERHLYIIQKLQRDKTEILKRFHLNKPKTQSAVKIRTKSRFTGTISGERDDSLQSTDLEIIDDMTGSESLEDTQNSLWLRYHSRPGEDRHSQARDPNKDLWESFNDSRYRGILKISEPDRMSDKNSGVKNHSDEDIENIVKRSLEINQGPRGFILPTINNKKADSVRSNVTPGTRESKLHSRAKSVHDKTSSNPQRAAPAGEDPSSGVTSRVDSVISSKAAKSLVNVMAGCSNSQHNTVVMWSTMDVPDQGGCFDLPELGVRLSIPGGVLSKGQKTQTLTVTLSWGEVIPVSQGYKQPVGPTIDIKPNGIPFNKPIVVSLPHNVTCRGRQDRSHLILMQQDTENEWEPVANDSQSLTSAPLGFITPHTVIVQMKSSGKYSLVSATKDNFCPQALRVLGLCSYHNDTGHGMLQLDVYCTEDSLFTDKLYQTLTDSGKEHRPAQYFVFDQSLSLSGEVPVQVCVQDMMDGWQVKGQTAQMFDPSKLEPGLSPVVTFTLQHTLSQLRCLLAKMTFTQGQGEGHSSECPKDSISICVDLDQLDFLGQPGVNKSMDSMSKGGNKGIPSSTKSNSPRRSATFMTDYHDNGTRQNIGRVEVKVKVKSQRNISSWIPDDVKSELVEEIKEDMPSLDKWFDLIAALNMGMFTEVLNQSSEPVRDLLCYCEVTGVSVVKVKDILQTMRFEEASKVLTNYLKEYPLE